MSLTSKPGDLKPTLRVETNALAADLADPDPSAVPLSDVRVGSSSKDVGIRTLEVMAAVLLNALRSPRDRRGRGSPTRYPVRL